MAILKDNVIVQAPTISKENKLKRTVNNIGNISGETFNKLVSTQRQGIDLVWNNSDLTPQEVIDGLGADAIKVFQFHGALTQFIQALSQIDNVSVDLKFPTKAFEIENGVITVLNTPYVP